MASKKRKQTPKQELEPAKHESQRIFGISLEICVFSCSLEAYVGKWVLSHSA